ncbi:MAG: response regulator [Spirochaetaceae bacterium]|nr:response regulator [Spirochaetaceae bacterium]
MLNHGPRKKKFRALIVDDVKSNLLTLNEILKNNYIVQIAMNGNKALEIANKSPSPDIILLDVLMPGMDGYEVCRQLKRGRRTADIPVIFVTSMNEIEDETYGLQIGASDYLRKPVNPDTCRVRVGNQLRLIKNRELLKNRTMLMEKLVLERSLDLLQTQDVTIQCIASLAETRDNETGNHILRTRSYMELLSSSMAQTKLFANKLNEDLMSQIVKSAPLHDIGKVGIPDSILLKPGKLTQEEFEVMKLHTIYGGDALDQAEKRLGGNSFLQVAREIAYYHHERWDGTGYPNGLSEEEIPLCGRIMAVADVYDALISKRCYKPPFSHAKAVELIVQGSGSQFDPNIIDVFKEVNDSMRILAMKKIDDPEQLEALRAVN